MTATTPETVTSLQLSLSSLQHVCVRKKLRVTNAGHMYKWCWCLGLIKQLRSHWPLEWKAERGKLEIRNNKQSHPTQKHFNMPTREEERKRWRENATGPNWTFARHDGKNGDVFCSVFTSTLPCSSLQTLNCIYELSDTFSDNKSSWKFQGLFFWQAWISIFEYVADFLKTSLSCSRMHGSRVEYFHFRIPSREEFNACCILFCSEWHLKLASDEVYFLRLRRQTRPGK